jgi:hypothetical protein
LSGWSSGPFFGLSKVTGCTNATVAAFPNVCGTPLAVK